MAVRIPGNIVTAENRVKLKLDLKMNYTTKDFRLKAAAERLKKNFDAATQEKGCIVEDVNREALKWVQRRAKANLNESIEKNQRFSRTNSKRLEKAIVNSKYSASSYDGFQFLVADSGILAAVPYYLAVERGSRASVGRLIPLLFLSKNKKSGEGSYNTNETTARQVRTPRRPDPTRGNARRGARGRFIGPAQGGSALSRRRTKTTPSQTVYKTDRIIGPSERLRQSGGGSRIYNGQRLNDFKGKHFGIDKAFFVRVKRPVPAYRYAEHAGAAFRDQKIWKKLMDANSTRLDAALRKNLPVTVESLRVPGGARL